ncbi:hypothetical protein B0H15DRAFT_491549 [Mycena belliarum]|uniref:Uncharacterized protein n=1 Tax=Mycena belliarum TaxID=1033014 RepID=A0AAD6XMB5_9AGAR|nr:hypothetical protein B0H15DRAFT_491549 [Mycena belliae]
MSCASGRICAAARCVEAALLVPAAASAPRPCATGAVQIPSIPRVCVCGAHGGYVRVGVVGAGRAGVRAGGRRIWAEARVYGLRRGDERAGENLEDNAALGARASRTRPFAREREMRAGADFDGGGGQSTRVTRVGRNGARRGRRARGDGPKRSFRGSQGGGRRPSTELRAAGRGNARMRP